MAPDDDLLSERLRQQTPRAPAWDVAPTDKGVANIERTFQWLEKAGLRDNTEALII